MVNKYITTAGSSVLKILRVLSITNWGEFGTFRMFEHPSKCRINLNSLLWGKTLILSKNLNIYHSMI